MPWKDKKIAKTKKKEYYERKKSYYAPRAKEQARLLKIEKRAYVTNYLLTHPCIDCGESDIVVLDFDHVRGEKYNNISNLVLQHRSMEKLKEEILKCDIRCSNCHRRITHKRRLENGRSKN